MAGIGDIEFHVFFLSLVSSVGVLMAATGDTEFHVFFSILVSSCPINPAIIIWFFPIISSFVFSQFTNAVFFV